MFLLQRSNWIRWSLHTRGMLLLSWGSNWTCSSEVSTNSRCGRKEKGLQQDVVSLQIKYRQTVEITGLCKRDVPVTVYHTLQKCYNLKVQLIKHYWFNHLPLKPSSYFQEGEDNNEGWALRQKKAFWQETWYSFSTRCGLRRNSPFKTKGNAQGVQSRQFLRFKKKCFVMMYLSWSILMSNGPSFCREKPLSGVSNCMEEQPASRRTPSRLPGSTPDEINKASDWLNRPKRGWSCFL